MSHQLRVWVGAIEPLAIQRTTRGSEFILRQRPGNYRFSGSTPSGGLELSRGANSLQFIYQIGGIESERKRTLLNELIIQQDPPQVLVNAGTTPELGNLNFEDTTQRINLKEILNVGSRVIVPGSARDIDGNAIADGAVPTFSGVATAHFQSKCILITEDVPEQLRGYVSGVSDYSDLNFILVEII